MKKFNLLPPLLRICVVLSLIALVGCSPSEDRVEKLLSKMTLEEKVGQMAQITLDVVGKGADRYSSDEPFVIDTAALRQAIVTYRIGAVLNTTNNRALTVQTWNQIIGAIQDMAIHHTDLAIPIIYGVDQTHGTTYTAGGTIFPQQIALAATFNPVHAYNMGVVTAYESKACGITWNFSPVLDLGADPRFSRQFEGFGEDPYVGTIMGVEMVKGIEGLGGNIASPYKMASCAKHFLGYSVPNTGKDRTPAFIPDHVLREYHLPAFKAAIEQGAHTLMVNSGLINGVSVHASKSLITDLLRKELGFDGVVVTDWQDIENLYTRDRLTVDIKGAIKLAIDAGIDMSMIAYRYEDFCDNLVALVKEGAISESRIDESVRRILKLKFDLGLFEAPTPNSNDYPDFGSAKFAQHSYHAASEAITLLKNKEQILPLPATAKILVCGPNAHNMRTLNGGWTYSWQGEKTDQFAGSFNTIFESLQDRFGKSQVQYLPGVSYVVGGKYYQEQFDQLDRTIAAAKSVEYIVLCVGENSYTEKPGDLNDMYLGALQIELAQRLAAVGKPIIMVLTEGRPRCVSQIESYMSAVLLGYLPGNFGSDALADIMIGRVNPSGRLPYNYPRYPNSLVNYYHKPSEEQVASAGAYHYESDYNPQWEFGFGLSYTQFEYSDLLITPNRFTDNDSIVVTVNLTNKGTRVGKEAVLLYSTDMVASMSPDCRRLRAFEKIELQPNETRTVRFVLTHRDLAFVNTANQWVCEPGEFIIKVGDQAANLIKL